MQIYLLTIFSVLIFGVIDARINRYNKWSVLRTVILLILVSVAGLRYQVGTDYGAYAGGFPQYIDESISFNWTLLTAEPGIRVLARIIGLVYYDYALFIFVCSLITVGLYVFHIHKVSNKFWVSIVLFVLIGSWAVSFNAVRQTLAAAIVFAGHRYIFQRKLLHWSLIVLAATLFHVTALLVFFFYFIPVKQAKPSMLFAMAFAAAFGGWFSEYFFLFRGVLEGTDGSINEAGSRYAETAVNIFRVVIAWVPVLIYLFLLRNKTARHHRFSFYMNLTIVNAVLASITKDSALLFRFGLYSQIFLAISWPMIITCLNKSIRNIALIILLVLYLLWFMVEVGFDAQYNWIFNRQGNVY